MNRARLEQLLRAMKKKKILVIGDLMLDEYVWGKVERISPEAPVPVVHVSRESACPGGAANVARNLADIGVGALVCGLAGRDEAGRRLTALLAASGRSGGAAAGIDCRGVLLRKEFTTIVKTRIIARQQQVVRVDREKPGAPGAAVLAQLARIIRRLARQADALIIEDYGKGMVTQELVRIVVDAAGDKPVVVDPNSTNPIDWRGVTMVKPNRQEAFSAAGMPVSARPADLRRLGEQLLHRWQVPMLLMTLGEEGMMLFRRGQSPYASPTRAREVFDVSGAGDTVIAFFTAALAAGADAEEATEIANHAAGIVVGKVGTATLTEQELLAGFDPHG